MASGLIRTAPADRRTLVARVAGLLCQVVAGPGARGHVLRTFIRPGLDLSDDELATLVGQLRGVADGCFAGGAPTHYQALRGRRRDLVDKVITIAKGPGGEVVGFSSAVIFNVLPVGDVLHLGLTCVRPESRGRGLCHLLVNRNFTAFLLYNGLQRHFWITNVSSLVAGLAPPGAFFDDTYPSHCSRRSRPSQTHLTIASAVSAHFRDQISIRSDAPFDPDSFVFTGGNFHGPFQHVERQSYGDAYAAAWYLRKMAPHRGDAMLQVGQGSLLGVVKHLLRAARGKSRRDG